MEEADDCRSQNDSYEITIKDVIKTTWNSHSGNFKTEKVVSNIF
jgi:hypothetical protein